MSKIGKQPIQLPEGVTATVSSSDVLFAGKLGELTVSILPFVTVATTDRTLTCATASESLQGRANWGTMRALLANAVKGVSEGYAETLQIDGIGFRANLEGNVLVLNVGFTHPVRFTPPVGVVVVLEKNLIKISGCNKQMVGEAAAQIRSIRKPEPYQGKGIHYKDEVIRRKEGKKVAGATTT